MRLCVFVLVLSLAVGIAFGADIDGTWEGEMDMMGQTMPISYTFKAEGNVLTGYTPVMEQKMEIQDGKIDGNNISFFVVFNFGEEMKVEYKGVLSGNELKLSWDMMGQPTEVTLKKAK